MNKLVILYRHLSERNYEDGISIVASLLSMISSDLLMKIIITGVKQRIFYDNA